ncbi:hypothetical protein QBC46DRAFT_22938 [Diplogelasinospora grovesii]|uniref:Transmembrane protein n=1 Tax=Diplogelasinospora grovesii TaxID=303347 RepID=A0AAN6NF02_9PEZI|nr:hypothetical protein QBC46DRAFT_22938 [Diplogelasinospora grovesii]
MPPRAVPTLERVPTVEEMVIALLRPQSKAQVAPEPEPQPKFDAFGQPLAARDEQQQPAAPPLLPPTSTTADTVTHIVEQRQNVQTSTIPAYYGSLNSGPDPGTVVGITLGSVAGFILCLWLIYTCINLGNPPADLTTEGTASVVTMRKKKRHSYRHSRHGGETVEIRRTSSRAGGPTILVEEERRGSRDRGERIVVEERRRSVSRTRYAGGPVPPPPRVVNVHDMDGEDEVVVIEEQSPPRRHRSSSIQRSQERRSSGFRDIYPNQFAGGDAPPIEVRRSSTSRRR